MSKVFENVSISGTIADLKDRLSTAIDKVCTKEEFDTYVEQQKADDAERDEQYASFYTEYYLNVNTTKETFKNTLEHMISIQSLHISFLELINCISNIIMVTVIALFLVLSIIWSCWCLLVVGTMIVVMVSFGKEKTKIIELLKSENKWMKEYLEELSR